MMINQHPAAGALQSLGVFSAPADRERSRLLQQQRQRMLDSAADAAGSHAATAIRDDALAMLGIWAGTPASDLGEGETLADRLIAMAVGVADENQDGELTDDEADVVEVALSAMADYLSAQGVSDEDIDALLNNADAEAAGRVQELLAAGEGDDTDLDSFLFDAESSEAVLDDVRGILDAVYKKTMAVRKGKKVRVMKRVSGKVVLSAAQKVAIRKATTKARSATARVRRMKSMKVRENAGLNK